ncbi:MAG: glycosyltransferase [Cytophagaceae bacterium]|nr:glycosyltransferase [Cytophagaceae bacterium]
MSKPRVSVCIPAYRQTRYLRRALDSLRIQSFQDFELVVADDSPDDSVKTFLDDYAFGEKLRYVHNDPALGTPENWNEAVRQAQGGLIKILHHDDWLTQPDSLARLVDALDTHPEAGFAFCASVNTFDSGAVRDVNHPTARQVRHLRQHPDDLFAANCIGAPSATLYRRSVGLAYDRTIKYTVDIDFYIRLFRQNPAFVFVDEPLVAIGLNEGQVTQAVRHDRNLMLREYAYTYQKLGLDARKSRRIARFWWAFFHRFNVRSLADFRAAGYTGPVDGALRGLIRLAPLYGILDAYLKLKKRLIGEI